MIGIITLFYDNYNLGGMLQAYALQHFIVDKFGPAEQIRIRGTKRKLTIKQKALRKIRRFLKNPFLEMRAQHQRKINNKENHKIANELFLRKGKMRGFCAQIQSSSEVYNSTNIDLALQHYEAFIVGSDQVWNNNFEIIRDNLNIFLLEFVTDSTCKLSYAASIGRDIASDLSYRNRLNSALESYEGISVREKSAMDSFVPDIKRRAEVHLDPTFLLGSKQWEAVSLNSNWNQNAPYVFTYFLGDEKNNRLYAKKIAQEEQIGICAFIHARNSYCRFDEGYADKEYIDYSVEDFLAAIRDSSLVITDSFHAVVFSIIFHKKFIALERGVTNTQASMNSRIKDLLDMFGFQDRWVGDNMKRVPQSNINYSNVDLLIDSERNRAINFFSKILDRRQ